MPLLRIIAWFTACLALTLSHPSQGRPFQANGAAPRTEQSEPGHVDRYGDPLPDRAIARLGTIRWRYGPGVQSMAFSPDSRFVAVAGKDSLYLFDVSTGKPIWRVRVGTRLCTAFAFSPDGSALAWADASSLHLRRIGDGRELVKFDAHPDFVTGISFAPDGKHIATTGRDGTLRVWDCATGRELCHFEGRSAFDGDAVGFSRDGNRLAAAGPKDTIRIWDLTTKKEVQRFEQVAGNNRRVSFGLAFVGFTPDGGRVVSAYNRASFGTSVKVWDVRTGKLIRESNRRYSAVALSADHKTVLYGTSSGRIFFWQVDTGRELETHRGGEQEIRAVALSTNGELGGFADEFGTIRLWRIANQEASDPLGTSAGEPLMVEFIDSGSKVFSGSGDGTLRLWEPRSGRQVRQLSWNLHGSTAMALSPDGTTVASAKDGALSN